MKINFFPKIIFLFIGIVLLFPKLHAEVQVLCLGEGECVTLENYVHPGSLSGATYQEKLDYFNWLKDQAGPYGITLPVVGFSESDPVVGFSESDLDQLDKSTDELVGGYDEIKGKRFKIDGYLEEFALSKIEAESLIMSARNIVFK